jgi:hypothetical protein
VDEKEQRVITFKLPADESAALDAKAEQAGMNRSDYIRMVLSTPTNRLEGLMNYALCLINQTHEAVYSIAEAEGAAGHFLSYKELRTVYDEARGRAIKFAAELPEHFTEIEAEIASERAKQQS